MKIWKNSVMQKDKHKGPMARTTQQTGGTEGQNSWSVEAQKRRALAMMLKKKSRD